MITSFKPTNLKVKSNTSVTIELVVASTSVELFVTSNDSRAVVDSVVTFLSPTVSQMITVDIGDFATGERFSVTAHYAGESAICEFEIVANSIASITIDPPTFSSGDSVDITFTLDSPANVGGTYIRLKQLREEAFKIPILIDLPVSIQIPAGNTSVTLTATAATTSLVLRDTIVAILNGIEVGLEVGLNG
jgi:hypothetical protein